MRWLCDITNLMDMGLSKLRELVKGSSLGERGGSVPAAPQLLRDKVLAPTMTPLLTRKGMGSPSRGLGPGPPHTLHAWAPLHLE